MDDSNGLERHADPGKFEHDTATGAIAESGDPVRVDTGHREKDIKRGRPIACIRSTSANRGMTRASITSGRPKNTWPP